MLQNFRRISCIYRMTRSHIATSCALPSVYNPTLVEEIAKPVTNEPIIKDMFLGRINTEMLVYPEMDNNEDVQSLEMMSNTIESFIKNDVDSKWIDENSQIPKETMDAMKQLGLFGQQIPVEYGGLGLNATQYSRICENIALDGGIATTLAAHQAIGLKGILLSGNEMQKDKYLPKLASGEYIAAFCLTEPGSGSDAQSIQTTATLSEDGTHYLLNGNKIWISNGGIADVMTVFAKTQSVGEKGTTKERITAFIVERKFGGVISGKPENKMGIRGSNTTTVTFEDTPVPVENVLGEVGQGFKLALNILNSGRFSMGSSGAGVLKFLLTSAVEHALTRKQFGRRIGDFQQIKDKLAKIATAAYVMESMTYLTAGLLDKYEKPDLSLEAAAVKIFSSEAIWNAVNETMQIFGGMGYMADYPYERYIRDARIVLIYEGTNEILRMFVAGNAIQHAAKSLLNDKQRFKDPLNNIKFIIDKIAEHSFARIKGSRQHLEYSVHPNFSNIMKEIGRYTFQFSCLIQELLVMKGRNVIEEQMKLRRCADVVIDLYAVLSCVSRASRSVAIGLRNADHERDLTYAFTKEAFRRIEDNLNGITKNAETKPDAEYLRIADTIYEAGEYCAAHPLLVKR